MMLSLCIAAIPVLFDHIIPAFHIDVRDLLKRLSARLNQTKPSVGSDKDIENTPEKERSP